MNTPQVLGPLITDLEGVELSQVDKEMLVHPKLGGLIFFSRNYESKEQLIALIRCVREIRPDLFLSVDHEGGRVQRFKKGFTHIPPMAQLGDHYESTKTGGSLDQAYDYGWLLAYELTSLGIDHSYAPVLDLDDHRSQVIGDRSFSKNPDTTICVAQRFIHGMNAAGMSATAKHFPGHGSVIADSHLELPIDNRSFDLLVAHDLRPFVELKHDYKALMTAHIAFPEIDDQPVSFSKKWLREILRDQLGFKGIVISDDLSMKGATTFGSASSCAEKALSAGCDAVLVCNTRTEAERALEHLEAKALGVADKLRPMIRNKAVLAEQGLSRKYTDIQKRLGI